MLDRRLFLAGMGASALSMGLPVCRGRADRSPLETLSAPLQLTTGQSLIGRRFKLSPSFAWDSRMAAIYIADGATDVTIQDLELIGVDRWQSRWNEYIESGGRGINTGTAGIRAQGAPRIRIENVRIRGFPRAGIFCFGADDGIFRDITFQNCFQGLNIAHFLTSSRVLIERVNARDMWGPAVGRWPGVGGNPSRVHRGGFIGSDGFVLSSLRNNSTVRDCTCFGEFVQGAKLANAIDVVVEGYRGMSFQIQGDLQLAGGAAGTKYSQNVTIRNSVIDRSLGTRGGGYLNGLLCSLDCRNTRVESTIFRAAGQSGHGIQWNGTTGVVTGCTFDGWNQEIDPFHPAYAMEIVSGSTVNADFAKVNTFVNQIRILHTLP